MADTVKKKEESGDVSLAKTLDTDSVNQAQSNINSQLAQTGAAKSGWQAQLDDTMNKILNRENFSYDLNGDALYQQYKDRFVQQGKTAMMDTMGQAAALTGGYGNSYAQSAGQQAYHGYLQGLNDVVPELYQLAYQKYKGEGDALADRYNMLANKEQQDYDRQQTAYGNLQGLISATGMKPTEEQLKNTGMTQEEADALRLAWARTDPAMALRGGYITDEEYNILAGAAPGGGFSWLNMQQPFTGDEDTLVLQKAINHFMGSGILEDGIRGTQTNAAESQFNSWLEDPNNSSAYDAWLKANL